MMGIRISLPGKTHQPGDICGLPDPGIPRGTAVEKLHHAMDDEGYQEKPFL